MVSGLASSIRAAAESATFDLAGHDTAFIRSTVKDAFSELFHLDQMIRITFVVGAGKLSRQKYDDKAMFAVTSTLKQLDYVEDRGASCVNECGGCYKTQHDTGKNLFTVVVFPRLAGHEDGRPIHGGGKDESRKIRRGDDYEPLIPINSPGYKMAVCRLPTFQNLLSAYCPTYSEKKECLRCLEGLLQVEQAIESKMMAGQPLDPGEQSFYDEASELKEKYAHTQQEANKHVEEGKVTLDERRVLVEMNEKRIKALMDEKSSASVAEKLKKAFTRKVQLQKLCDEVLSMHSTSYPPPLRHESKISALRKKLLPLQALEDLSRGRLLTLDETRALAAKDELLEEICELEEGSRGWFEEDEAFRERLEKSRMRSRSNRNDEKTKIRSVGKGVGSGNDNSVKKWILPGENPKSPWGASSVKSKLKGKGGAVFTAMMLDSSSDEEESDGESVDDKKLMQPLPKKQHPAATNILISEMAESSVEKNVPLSIMQLAMTGSLPQTKKKRKKKTKAKTAPKEESMEKVDGKDDISDGTDSGSPSSISHSVLEFWKSFLMPFVMAIVSLILSLVTSMFKRENSKKKKNR
ncbi:hypothetical protein ACHAW5_001938 [Stephanodiscus triporus]|uniref:Uncharacterized protein n=1 Tax=Stephanodiscus triporus TaxID=2934178 RepID=A0ABD3MCJ1_9STRA